MYLIWVYSVCSSQSVSKLGNITVAMYFSSLKNTTCKKNVKDIFIGLSIAHLSVSYTYRDQPNYPTVSLTLVLLNQDMALFEKKCGFRSVEKETDLDLHCLSFSL